MVYKYKNAEKRRVGNEIERIDLYQGKNMPLNFVIGELNGFHGTMVNEKSIKYYYIIDGKAKVIINDEITDVEKGDFVVIPVNAKHSIEGNAEFAIICTPPFDPDYERKV